MEKLEVKIDNKPNNPMPKDYGKIQILKAPPKHILYCGCLYEKVDSDVLTISDGFYGMDKEV